MSKTNKPKMPAKIILVLAGIGLFALIIQIARLQLKPDAMVDLVEEGDIRDSVSGNVKVLAALSFQLLSETQSKIRYTALIPFGKPIPVDANQTIFLMETFDLDRSLERTQLSISSHQKRLKTGSVIELQLELEEKNLNALQNIFKENGDDISEFEIESKTNLVGRLRRQYEFEKISNEEISQALTLEEGRTKETLKKRKIVSPIKGTLVYSRVKKGDTVFSGQLLGEIQSHERLIEVTLNEEDFSGIEEGQRVGVTIFSFGNEIFEGEVSRLSTSVDPTTGYRKLYVELDTNRTLPVGSSGRAEIIKQEIQNTMIIPRKALLGNSVFAVRNGKATQINVVTGAKNMEHVEIIKGLKINDHVISEAPHLFYDGEQVSSIILE